jgi:hypothetical protein
VLVGLVAHAYLWKSGSDFQVFWLAGWRVLNGLVPYDLGDGAMPFKYAPPIALLLVPLAWLPEHLAYLLWLLLSAFALLRFVRWSQDALGMGPDARGEALVLLGLAPLVAHLFALGQCDALLLWALAESERRRRTAPLRSGALWALTCLAKPPYLLLAALVAWRGESRRAEGFLLGTLLMFGGVAAFLGPTAAGEQVQAWVELLRATTPSGLCGPQNQSVSALVCTYGRLLPGTGPFALAVTLASGLAVAAGAWCVRAVDRQDRPRAEALAVMLVFYGTALLSPLGWRTNLLGLVPALSIVFSRDTLGPDVVRRRARTFSIGALALTGLALNYEVLGPEGFRGLLHLRMHALLGIAVTTCAVLVSFRRSGAWTARPVEAAPATRPWPAHPARSWAFLVGATLFALATVWVRPGPAILREAEAVREARVASALAASPLASWASPRLDGSRWDTQPPAALWLEAGWMRAVGPGPAAAWRWGQLLGTLLVLLAGAGALLVAGPSRTGLVLLGLCTLPGFLVASQNPTVVLPSLLGLATCLLGGLLLDHRRGHAPLAIALGVAIAAWSGGLPGLAASVVVLVLVGQRISNRRGLVLAGAGAVVLTAAGVGALEVWRAALGAPPFLPAHLAALTSPERGDVLRPLARWVLPVPLALLATSWRWRATSAARPRRFRELLGAVLVGSVAIGLLLPVEEDAWWIHAAIAGSGWVLAGVGLTLVRDSVFRWLRPERVLVAAAVALAWIFFPVPKHGDDDALYWLYAGERAEVTREQAPVIANCSSLVPTMAEQTFPLVLGARAVPCSAAAALTFDGREIRRAR